MAQPSIVLLRKLLSALCVVAGLATSTTLAQPSSDTEQPPKTQSPLQPLQQPGDDELKEIPGSNANSERTESLAHYMEAIAAEKSGDYSEAIDAYKAAINADEDAAEPRKAYALLLMRLGRMRQAEKVALEAIERDPDDFQTRFRLAVLLLSQRKPNDAVVLLDDAVKSKRLKTDSPEYIRLHSIRGRLAVELGINNQAAESYSIILKALERPEDFGLDFREHNALMKDQATEYQTVGQVMLRLGRIDEAITAFTAKVRVSNDQPGDYHYLLAVAQFRKDDVATSEENLNIYFTTGRRQKEALELLRDLYSATSRSDEIIPRLKELARDTTDAGTVNLFLGTYQLEQGDLDAAARTFEEVIKQSGDADAHLGLVRVDILKQDSKSLLAGLQKAVRARIQFPELVPLQREVIANKEFASSVVSECVSAIEEDNSKLAAEVILFCGLIAEQLEEGESEEKLLKATLDTNPSPTIGLRVLEQLGINQLSRQKYEVAAMNLRRLLSVPGLPDGRRVMALYRLSFAESFRDNHEAAITAAKAALEIGSQSPELTYQLGWVLVQATEYDEAGKVLREALQLAGAQDPPDQQTSTRSRLLLGALYSQIEDWERSIETYQQLIDDSEIDEDTVRRARLALSNAYVQMGDLPAGEKVLEEVYASNPDDPGVNNDLGYLYADQGKNLEKAEEMIRLAVAAEPKNAAYLDSLGWVLFRLKKYDEALEVLEEANADPNYRDATIIEHLGDVQQALMQQDEARKSWQDALEVEKKSPKPDQEIIDRLNEKLKTGAETPAPTE